MSEVNHLSKEQKRKLLAYIVRRNRNATFAEDILQETQLRVIEQSRKQTILDPLAYAYRVADTIIYAAARKDSREVEIGDTDFVWDAPSADHVLEYKQRIAVFRDCLLRLPRLRREIFIKRHLEDKSRRQIADELHMSLEAVKKHLVRAMAELSLAIAHHENGNGKEHKDKGTGHE